MIRHRATILGARVRRIGGKDERTREGREKVEEGGGGRNLVCNYFGVHLTRAMHSAGEGLLTNGEKARSVTVAVAAA